MTDYILIEKIWQDIFCYQVKITCASSHVVATNDIYISDDSIKYQEGTGIQYASDWQTYFNGKTGWVCIGNPDCNSKSKGVEFAKNTVAVIDNEQLSSIWIKPQFI